MLKTTHVLDCGLEPVSSAAFSSDGKLFASASDDGTIRLWDDKGTLQQTLFGHREPVNQVIFSPNSKLLMSASDEDNTVRRWNVDDGTGQELEGCSGPIAFSPNGTEQASYTADGTVKLSRGAVIKTLELDQPLVARPRSKMLYRALDGRPEVKALAFSPDGSLLACGYDNGMLKLWDMKSKYADDHHGGEDSVTALAFSQDGEILASALYSGTIKLWDVQEARYTSELQGSRGGARCLAFSRAGKLLALASLDNQIKLWDLAQNKLLRNLDQKDSLIICALSFEMREQGNEQGNEPFPCSIRVGVCNGQDQGHYSVNICNMTIK